jgi:hypothetical protein
MPTRKHHSNLPGSIDIYAIRRVNPFMGVLQVIETGGGRAISANGVVWDIEVLAERSSSGWGSLNRDNKDKAYYRYGLWSLEDGLVSRPLAPHLESDPLTKQCNVLINHIREHIDELPFKLVDDQELWLFDSDNHQPLALLAASSAHSKRPSPEPKYWSCSIGANGVPSQRRYPAATELELRVKQRAGFNINKSWISRQPDGSGINTFTHEIIDRAAFPSFLLTEDWPDSKDTRLASGYVDWISPSLLTLQSLERPERERLENSLNIQAISVEHHRHLYPEIIDHMSVKAARVQCRLQKSVNTE